MNWTRCLAALFLLLIFSGCTKREPRVIVPACYDPYVFFTVNATDEEKFDDFVDRLQILGATILQRYVVAGFSNGDVHYGKPNHGVLLRSSNQEVFARLAGGQIPNQGLSEINAFCGAIPDISKVEGEAYNFFLIKRKGGLEAAERNMTDAFRELKLTEKYGVSPYLTMTVKGSTGVFTGADQIFSFVYRREAGRKALDQDKVFLARLKDHIEKYAEHFELLNMFPLPASQTPEARKAALAARTEQQNREIRTLQLEGQARASRLSAESLMLTCAGNLFSAAAEIEHVFRESLIWAPENYEYQKLTRARSFIKRALTNLSEVSETSDRFLSGLSKEEKKNREAPFEEMKARGEALKPLMEKIAAEIDAHRVPKMEDVHRLLSKAIAATEFGRQKP